ncbi:torsin-1A-interacting protein 1-like [Notolabrus celidotus]|uniref:torsin-1A-interacting protein 1-like n=1 Tax=Notolabrus celidotus TaxID=1203425 RepID=UPI001490294F|nr:torsin-1A-interacting protein 1-like [Notolabrus celidotus]
MDPETIVRRSTRISSAHVLSVEPTPRGPLKRTRKRLENQASAAAMNGSKDEENYPEDGESPNKKNCLGTDQEAGGGGDGGLGNDIEMDDQESAEELEKKSSAENNHYQEFDRTQDHFQAKIRHNLGAHGDMNFNPRVALGERCRASQAIKEDADSNITRRVKPPSKGPVVPTKSAEQIRPPEHRHNESNLRVTSMAEYKKKMEEKMEAEAKSSAFNHHVPRGYPSPEKPHTRQRHMNNLMKQRDAVQPKKKEIKKAAAIKKSSGHSSRGFMWYFCCLVLLALFGCAVFLAYKSITVQRGDEGSGGEVPFRAVKLELFADQLSLLVNQFPSQRPDVWKRSGIHLENHLKTAQPTEPVSLLLTAGLRAERTLHCLAQGLASAFSSALNASVLQFDGARKASMNSDEVKLDIDSQLRAAFEGDKPAAVIHRFEELPPGSTIIFYRYCDHENAAYKGVFLLFTVLLPQNEVGAEVSLREVEETVLDFLKERMVGSSGQTAFNEMDNDKFGGLWSRISHHVLPVVSEEEVEQKGC